MYSIDIDISIAFSSHLRLLNPSTASISAQVLSIIKNSK